MHENYKNNKIAIATTILLAIVGLYLAAYKTAHYWYPNSNDGPGEGFNALFAPLNEVSVKLPEYLREANSNGGLLDVQIEWVNLGNGYVYFVHNGTEQRVYAGAHLNPSHEDTLQRLKFTFTISTDENFEQHVHVTADLYDSCNH